MPRYPDCTKAGLLAVLFLVSHPGYASDVQDAPVNHANEQAAAATVKAPSSSDMVGALNGVFGAHLHARANHAHGSLYDAVFTPTAQAAAISRAPHFANASSAVLVRFSNFGGIPDISDGDAGAAPYGMSLKFFLPDGQETDLVMHSFNGFPSATTADFVDFVKAMALSGPGAARPTALERYADAHPPAKAFLDAAKPAPVSFAAQPYYGVNTFKFTNAAGTVRHGRYRMVPLAGAGYLDAQHAVGAPADYLRAELQARLKSAPVVMLLQLQLADSGDALENPSIAWPETRHMVDLGRLTITAATPDATLRDRSLVFYPDELPDGIEPNDPMLKARTRAYAESLQRRQ